MARKQEQIRGAVVTLARAGHTNSQISELCKVTKQTVHSIRSRFEAFVSDGGDPDQYDIRRTVPKQRSDTVSKAKIAKIRQKVTKNPSQSLRKMAKDLDISRTALTKVVKNTLHLKSYTRRKAQILTEDNKTARKERSKILLNRLKKSGENGFGGKNLIFFSDEKNFTQDQKCNSRNNRWLASDPSEVPVVSKTKFPQTVMVLGVVSNEGDVMPPFFFEKGLKVNAQVYVDVLRDHVKPWMDTIAKGRKYTFQQDGAPAHTAKLTQDWCEANLPNFLRKDEWPPSSPDLNVLDYYFWGVMEGVVNASAHSNMESLKRTIVQAFDGADRDMLKRACSKFRTRLECCIEANGNFFE